jgi:hypothetical protein
MMFICAAVISVKLGTEVHLAGGGGTAGQQQQQRRRDCLVPAA